MKNSILATLVFIICTAAHAQQVTTYECVHYEKADLIFPGDRAAQDAFYAKLDSLIAAKGENINIWQVGGSHIQGGSFPYKLMENFQTWAGRGERGFLFPRQLAGTHADSRYRMTSEGKWFAPMLTKYSADPKPRYGITGFAARCDSAAWIGLNIDPQKKGLWHFNKVRILGYGSSSKAYPEVLLGGKKIRHQYDSLTASYVFNLPSATDSIRVNFIVPEGEHFVFNGLQPITGKKGVNYFASGVNGAKVTAWADQCADLERDLKLVKPDLVIFGLGINDSAMAPEKFSPDKFKAGYRRLIEKIQKTSPDCAFIFVTNNDSFYYIKGGMTHNLNAEAVRKSMVELALEYGAGVWDLYGLMGGDNSVITWTENGLVGKDKLHFTTKGYKLLGDLLFEAIKRDWQNTKK